MSRIDKLIKQLEKMREYATSENAKELLRKNFEEVYNEAVLATVIAENRKHTGKSFQLPKFEDK